LESARSYINEDFQEQSKEVINGILTKAYNLDYATPNLNFKIRRVEIKNFALIQDLVIEDLSANLMKLNIVSGRNGSGKTSLFRFIEYMLIGKLNGKREKKKLK
jgi:ABC-type molybdenum transport system ATPase subunit/photorepair protein PhrA